MTAALGPLERAGAQALVRNAARRGRFAAGAVHDLAPEIAEAAFAVAGALRSGGIVLVFGNGGSAACAQHFAAEFTGKLSLDRVPMAAVALSTDTSALTAIANDYGYDEVFARQVRALGGNGGVAVGLSTSGTSRNVRLGIAAARELGLATIALTGATDELGAEHSIRIPLRETARIQEAHDLVLHELAQLAERILIPELADDAAADRFPFVLGQDDLATFREWADDQTLVTTNGVFDVLHEGHRASLAQARALGDRLVVLLNSDESVRRLKGPSRPIRPQEDRIRDLEGVDAVDHVVVMEDDVPSGLLEVLRPHVHAKGGDYAQRGLPEAEVVERGGGRVEYLTLVEGYSTSAMESKVRGQ